MKKLFVILLLALSLTACGGTKEEATDYTDELIKEGVIYIGTSPDYPPYESIDEESGAIVGFDIDLMNSIGESLGAEIEYEAMEFSTIVSAVQTGQIDLGLSGFSYDPQKQVLFSDPYYTSSQTILYLKEDGYETIDDFKGLNVASQLGTTCYDLITSYEDISVTTGTDANVLVEALRTGAYDGVCLDTPVAQNYVNSDPNFAMLEPIAEDTYSIIAESSNELLISKINEELDAFMQTDEYSDLLVKWGLN